MRGKRSPAMSVYAHHPRLNLSGNQATELSPGGPCPALRAAWARPYQRLMLSETFILLRHPRKTFKYYRSYKLFYNAGVSMLRYVIQERDEKVSNHPPPLTQNNILFFFKSENIELKGAAVFADVADGFLRCAVGYFSNNLQRHLNVGLSHSDKVLDDLLAYP